MTENITSSSNGSQWSFLLFSDRATAGLLATLGSVCFLVNVTIISLFLIDPLQSLRRPSGYLVASLNAGAILTSVSSVIVSLPGLINVSVLSVQLLFAIYSVASTASIGFIFILSYERYVLVTAPIKYKRVVTVGRVQILAITVWVGSAAIGTFLYLIASNAGFLWLSIPFAAIYIVLFGIDIKTFIEIRKMNSSIGGITEEDNQRSSLNQAMKNRIDMQTKFARVVVLLLVNFLFFASPVFLFHVLSVLNSNCGYCVFDSDTAKKIYEATIVMFIFHDTNTALFYLILIPKYRMSLIAIIKKCKTMRDNFKLQN